MCDLILMFCDGNISSVCAFVSSALSQYILDCLHLYLYFSSIFVRVACVVVVISIVSRLVC